MKNLPIYVIIWTIVTILGVAWIASADSFCPDGYHHSYVYRETPDSNGEKYIYSDCVQYPDREPGGGLEIEWTGANVGVGAGNEYFKSAGWLEDIELGLREDGVIVWRERKEKK